MCPPLNVFASKPSTLELLRMQQNTAKTDAIKYVLQRDRQTREPERTRTDGPRASIPRSERKTEEKKWLAKKSGTMVYCFPWSSAMFCVSSSILPSFVYLFYCRAFGIGYFIPAYVGSSFTEKEKSAPFNGGPALGIILQKKKLT